MRRREFITLLGGAAAAWPLAARAQQSERMRRIGVLLPAAADDPEWQARVAAFLQGLQQSGWTDRPQRAHRHPLGHGQCRPTFADMRRNWSRSRRTSSWPMAARPWRRCCRRPAPCRSCSRIVVDPVGAGFVESLARPGGNATGFHEFRIQHGREMAGAAQGDRAERDARGGPSGSSPRLRNQPVCRHPGRGAVAQGGGEPDRHARRRRDRARQSRPSRALRMAV